MTGTSVPPSSWRTLAPRPPPTPRAIRSFLREFLSDRRIVETHPLRWRPVLEGIILRVCPRASAATYATIWHPSEETSRYGSPLMHYGERQGELLQQELGESVQVRIAMCYGQPASASYCPSTPSPGPCTTPETPTVLSVSAPSRSSRADSTCPRDSPSSPSSPSSDPPPGSGRPPSTRSASSAAPVAPALTVICPGFVSDCLETLEKINQLNRETFTTAGGGSFHYFHYIPWGNDSDGAIATLAQQARKVLAGWI